MIFGQDNLAFSVLDAFEFSYRGSRDEIRGRNFHALSFRISSDAVFETDGKRISAPSGTVTYVPANVGYHRTAQIDDMIVIHFDLFNYISDDIQVIKPSEPEKCEKYFRAVLNEFSEKRIGYKYRSGAQMMRILELLNIDSERCGINRDIPAPVLKAQEYMRQYYSDGTLTVSRLAEMSYMSEAYFRRLFKRAFSVSPKAYLTNLRISYAVSLLNTGYFSIAEIAERSGFGDEKYFSTVFKKVTGYSPSKYNYKFIK